MRSPVADLLADLSAALAAVELDWYLFGAQAAIVYGVARLTADVDATVRVPTGLPLATVAGELGRRGFRPRFDDATFLAQARVLPFVHAASGLPVDLVLAGPGLEDECFARAVRRPVESALGQSDLLPALDEALARAARSPGSQALGRRG